LFIQESYINDRIRGALRHCCHEQKEFCLEHLILNAHTMDPGIRRDDDRGVGGAFAGMTTVGIAAVLL